MNNKIRLKPYFKYKSIIMVIKIDFFNDILIKQELEDFKIDILDIVNEIYKIIDLTVFEHFGMIIQKNDDEVVIVWEEKNFTGERTSLNSSMHSHSSSSSNNSKGYNSFLDVSQQIEEDNEHKIYEEESYDEISKNYEMDGSDESKNEKEKDDSFSFTNSSLSSEEKYNMMIMQEEIRQMYNSYEMSSDSEEKDKEKNGKEYFDKDLINNDLKGLKEFENMEIDFNDCFSLAVICAIKLCSRIFFNSKVLELNRLMNFQANGSSMKINPVIISLNFGSIKQYIINTNNNVSNYIGGKEVAKSLNLIVRFIC